MKVLVLCAAFLLPGLAAAAPDEALLGKAEGYPVCQPARGPQCLVGAWSAMDTLVPSSRVAKADKARALNSAARQPDLGIDAFLDKNRNTGLLVLQGDVILAERYQYERKPGDRFASASMAKTVLAMLYGFALEEKKIHSLDDQAGQYVHELKDHPYGAVTLRDLLTMSSGIKYANEEGDRWDRDELVRRTLGQKSKGGADTVRPFRERARPPGEKFHYSNLDSEVLGLVLRNAVGQPLAAYLSEKIWQPMGAEADATWLVDAAGFETGYCCLNATLRDYGRFGLLLASYGARDGKQVIPEKWVREATTAQAAHLKVGAATKNNGYGYQTWLLGSRHPRESGDPFAALGARGQAIFVDPARKLVVVHTAVHEQLQQSDGRREQFALWNHILEKVSN